MGSVRSAVISREGSDCGNSETLSVQDSDKSSSDTEVESESCYSGYGVEKQENVILPVVSNVFLTQGKKVHEPLECYSTSSETSLIQATKSGDISLVMKLITNECDLDATDPNHRTALHLACSLGRLEIVRLLVEGGANVDASSASGQTPLHEACINGRYAVLQEMLSEVVDLDMVDSNGLSAAHYCAMNGEVKCLSLLCNQVR